MKKDKRLIIIFLGILFFVLCCFPIQHLLLRKGIISLNFTDNWKSYEPIVEHSVLDKFTNLFNSKKVGIENRITSYFPFYISFNELYQNFNFTTNSLFYKEDIPLKTNSNGDFIFYNAVDDFFYLENNVNPDDLEERFNGQIAFFKGLKEKGIDTYLYLPTNYEYTTLKKNNLHTYVEKMKEELKDSIHIETMQINSIEQYKQYFYKTDHHWTMDGALEGYKAIMNLFQMTPKSFETETIQTKKYYGSIARSTMSDKTYDYLSTVKEKLTYDVLVNGNPAPKDFKPLVLSPRDYKYHDYYVQFYNGQYGEVMYDYHDDTKENLLIFGDSYVWSIDYLLASSFNKTYVINLRYDDYKNGEMDIEKFMQENDIQKVLFVGDASVLLFSDPSYEFAKKVK